MIAPWTLHGVGYMLMYQFDAHFIENEGFVPSFLHGAFQGGIGHVMYVDYQASPVGPYKELLFIPGKFAFEKSNWHSITKIYVSSEESVYWGRKNWGIPKEFATFHTHTIDKHTEEVIVTVGETEIFRATFQTARWLFPISTFLLPIQLIQPNLTQNNTYFETHPKGKGWGATTKISDVKVNPHFFPNIADKKPLFAVKVNRFVMKFPTPAVINTECR